ncbi:MAG: hypothetical protein AB1679_20470 [Actinomycetota bacterium]
MPFNPLEQQGIPLDQQLRNWSELTVEPYDKRTIHPYSRSRVIVMNGIEVESIIFSHQFNRMTDNLEIKTSLALARRVDQQQQKAVNWLSPGNETPLETTIGYEQVAIDLTAWVAQNEPDPYVKQTFDFGLLEDFDHLYRYANLYELIRGERAENLTRDLTEIMPGRPTFVEHRHPADDLRRHFDRHTVDPLTRMHCMTVTAAEQQTMNFYMNHGPDFMEPIARGLYLEIAMIEEQHVTQYESLIDPLESLLECLVFHKYNEVHMYHSFMEDETEDRRLKQLWELHLNMEIEQLKEACRLLQKYEGKTPEEILPPQLPKGVKFQSNKDYVRQVLGQQVDLRTNGPDFVPVNTLPADHRSFAYQKMVNAGGNPSEWVVEENREAQGREYRLQPEGEHPVADLREPARTGNR